MNEDLVCPLDWRYGSKEMRSLFSHESIIRRYAEVELALIKALSHIGLVKEDEVRDIEKAVKEVRAEEVDELEKKIGHDIMALATLIAEKSGDAGRFVHFGATSYDIVDTAYALIFRDALGIIKGKLKTLIIILSEYSIKYKNTIMVGRTHGQHALPITLGFKFANYVYELSRSYERLTDAEKRLIKGKMSGAVGTMAGWGEHALEVEKNVMDLLNLNPHEISTQVAPRDGYAEIILDLAILASQLDRLALEIRELMRPEILELAEGVGERVGSSTMPHKENPVTAEKISGLAKVARALSISALENIPLWHE
ncbi:MAG: adenylosuccinate lyase, partial [Sulfolobus sp.]|nr:adenylosuccinate lyase [Sulfolobus sp.]